MTSIPRLSPQDDWERNKYKILALHPKGFAVFERDVGYMHYETLEELKRFYPDYDAERRCCRGRSVLIKDLEKERARLSQVS